MVTFDSQIHPAPLDDGNLPRPTHLAPTRPATPPDLPGATPAQPLFPQPSNAAVLPHPLWGRAPAANTPLDCLDDVDCFDW